MSWRWQKRRRRKGRNRRRGGGEGQRKGRRKRRRVKGQVWRISTIRKWILGGVCATFAFQRVCISFTVKLSPELSGFVAFRVLISLWVSLLIAFQRYVFFNSLISTLSPPWSSYCTISCEGTQNTASTFRNARFFALRSQQSHAFSHSFSRALY